ncbi:outer membrane beta-barrel protein [Bradyrhizobium sp. OK095]|jgi:opacity protein-like surface antigen|uniref:outer membrane protein n=1 Tax=Bradyrhizobium sp. OK095 TaxID=1882760 RepID=UPI0008B510ED|nr:outer membrane beta-barrel protein [Bradyrhizobium sp. OK095]SEM67133.1 outer membrane immunogenic protein [Bradyrhizobium sp. OK095]
MHAHSERSVTLRRGLAAAVAVTSAVITSPVLAGGPLPAPVVSWSGFYAGVHGGWGWGKSEFRDPLNSPANNPFFAYFNGPLAGGQLGYNWQQGNYVLGAEIDGSWSFVKGNTSTSPIITSSTANGVGYTGFATATGRLGYASDQWLAYVKGGAAYARMELSSRFTADLTNYNRELFGAVGGVGLEIAFLRNVSAKVEYNAIYLPAETLHWVSANTTSEIKHFVQIVKAGINVHFNGDGGIPR